jgi:hypothetical protein
MRQLIKRTLQWGIVPVLGFVACNTSSSDEASKLVGTVRAAITSVPPSVFCVEVLASAGRDFSERVDVTPGQPATVTMTNVPAGNVTFTAFAYGRSCANPGKPTWASAPTLATVFPSQLTALDLTLQPVGDVAVGIHFGDGGVPDMSPDLAWPAYDFGWPQPDLAWSPPDLGSSVPDLSQPRAQLVASPQLLRWITSTLPQTTTITNVGAFGSGFLMVTIDPPYVISRNGCTPTGLSPGQSCDITIAAPPQFPPVRGNLIITAPGTTLTVELTSFLN